MKAISRRTGLKAGLAAGAAVAAGAWLTAPTAAATRGSGRIKLLLQVSWQGGVNYQGTVQELTDAFLAKHWLSRHRGVELLTQAGPASNGVGATAGGSIAAILAGNGPDIVAGCCTDIPSFMVAGILVPLKDWLRRDNVDIAVFQPSIIDSLFTAQGLVGLPDYSSFGPLYFNQGMFDELGLAYPSPDWTYEEADKIWRSVAGSRKGQQVYGVNFHSFQANQWIVRGWGGAPYDDATHSHCLLDSRACVTAYEWFVSLTKEKVATDALDKVGAIKSGQAAFSPCCCGNLQSGVMELGDALKWDLIPEPSLGLPQRFNYNGQGLYGMSALSKNPPDLIWDLLKFVTLDPRWQRFFNAQLAFMPPNNTAPGGWDDWMTIVRQVAPVLRTKRLEYFLDVASGAWGDAYFRYAPLEAFTIWGKYDALMTAGQMSPVEGLTQAAREINALQEAGRAESTAAAGSLSSIHRELATAAAAAHPVTFPQPSRAGEGAPFGPGTALVSVRDGAVSLSGAGSMAGGRNDDGTFACSAAATSSRGVYSCRLTSIAALGGQTLQGGAKAGLMVRGDLSDSAAMIFLDLDGPNGIHIDSRPVPGVTPDHQHAGVGGLFSSSGLVVSSSSAVANWLIKPVWFKWVRADDTWTAYTSLDGRTWQAAGVPVVGIQMAGAWVGPFVCSNNAPHRVRAVFDHLSGFTPDTFVVLGG